MVETILMPERVQFSLALEPEASPNGASIGAERLDALVGELIADLNSIQPGCAERLSQQAAEGSKGVEAFLLGRLQAVVSLENASKVIRFFETRLLNGDGPTPQKIRIKLAHTAANGSSRPEP